MPKVRLSVYLDADLSATLEAYADRRRRSKSLVAEAAIAAFLSPDAAERQEAAFARRLDRLSRQGDRLERDQGILLETLALFVRHWLTVTPAVPDSAQAAARLKGRERYTEFLEALGRRMARGARFSRELSFDIPDAAMAATSEPGEGPGEGEAL